MSQIVFVAPDEQMASVARMIMNPDELKEITIIIGALEDGVTAYREQVKEEPMVIVSRGGTTAMLRAAYPAIPVIDVPLTPYDWIRSMERIKKFADSVIVAGFSHIEYSLTEDVLSTLEKTFSLDMTRVIVSSFGELSRQLNKAFNEGHRALIGGRGVLSEGEKIGFKGVVLDAGPESIKQAFDEARRMIMVLEKEKENNRRMQLLVSSIAEGVLAVDEKGRVTMINKAAEKMLQIGNNNLVGKKLADYFPEHRLLECLESKVAVWGAVERHGDNIFASNRFPIIVGDQFFGAVSTFQEAQRLQSIERNIRKSLLEKGSHAKCTFDKIICNSTTCKRLIERAKLMAANDSTIVISGETGTGKEVFAQSIHNHSNRKKAPFVAINCAALPASILESEIFGYVDGAFTGARKGGKAGLFEEAHEGTIFLDEISEMPIELQSRLLRVLQEKEVMRLGDSRVIPIDVKVIASTNRDLMLEVREGRFREDLFYRLNVLRLVIPPLRERSMDIIPLLHHFLSSSTRINWQIEDAAHELLLNYSWPGNVRQLENIAERLRVLCLKPEVRGEDVTSAMEGDDFKINYNFDECGFAQRMESDRILSALQDAGGSKTLAAKKLGISRTTLWRKLKEIGKLECGNDVKQ